MEAIRTQCVQYVPTNLKIIIVSDGATAAEWIIKLDSENYKPDGSCADRVVPHGGVILFDETANLKPDFLQTCYNLLYREYGNIPIVLCSNKVNVNHVMMMGDTNICRKMENNITLPYFEISVNNDHNLEAPFLYLARKLTENVEDNNGCCSARLKSLGEWLRAGYYVTYIANAIMNCVGEA